MSLCVVVIIPTCNAGLEFSNALSILCHQSQKLNVLIVDSSSDDETLDIARKYKVQVIEIPRHSFNHGGTRQMAIDSLGGIDIAVFLTQDAILTDADSIRNILKPFHDNDVVAVCGRQLPRKEATLIEGHARIYNYPSQSFVRSINDVSEQGLKTAFMSNSFAA